ncbi:MAG: hypothetical protein HY855_17895 [Burkholderiales bacterium]|nr:hypothetical protein [Burkholderiales bacterium]
MSQEHVSPTARRAVVLGASMAGLLAARVLSERFGEVVLLERDELPDDAAPRKGTPQAVHSHGLLARGRQVIEALFPGFTQAMIDAGGMQGDLQAETGLDAARRRFARGHAGENGLAVSRLTIEAELRRRVRALPGVHLLDSVDVIAPEFDAATRRVVGVRYVSRIGDARGSTLSADLVVDCTGRGSRMPAWLASWGFPAPSEERVNVGLAYVTAYFRRDGALARGPGLDLVALICTATPELPRAAVLIAQEPGSDGVPRWVSTVGGYAGDHPAPTIQGMRERALQIGSPELVKLTHEGECIGEPLRYSFPHSLRRRYERLPEFPAGLLVMGDAQTSFNPIYGQGMTVAACESLALRAALKGGLSGLAKRYFKASAKVIDIPWQLAVGADLALPLVPGKRPWSVRFVNAYVARLYRAAAQDAVVARAFLRVIHLLDQPPALFAPGIVARVLWKSRQAVQQQGRPAAAQAPARTAHTAS